MNSVMFMDCFCYGFGIATASGISKRIVCLKVRLSKKFSIAATMVSISFGVGFALTLYNFSENIAGFLINDPEVIVKLTYMQRFYCPLVPLQLCQGVIYAVVRSIGQQHMMIYFQIIANYFVHFSVYFGLLWYTDTDHNELITISVGSTYFIMNLCGILIACCTDWTKAAEEVRKEMLDDEVVNNKRRARESFNSIYELEQQIK